MAIQVIDRAVKILRIIARRGQSSLTRISREASLPLPTTARILSSLAENGLVQRIDGRNYDLGARLLPLTTGLESLRKSLASVHPTLEKVSRITGTDAGFAVLQGNEAVVVDWCYGHRQTRVIEPYSREIPLYCAFGKVLIAFQPATWRQRFLSRTQLKRMAAGTVIDKHALTAEIVKIRQSGFHISYAENVDGAGSISVPVFDGLGQLHGALFITAPLDRVDNEPFSKHKALLLESAQHLSKDFSHVGAGRGRQRSTNPR
jgi:DNA-binding IclR family transcriptional regulator